MLLSFSIRTSKILMRLNALYYYFLFSRKHSYLLTAKVTPGVNKSNCYMWKSVWKSYCRWFTVCLTQILVFDYGLNHGVIILNRSNNSVFFYLKIYWNRQVSDLIRASGIWMKPETLRHQIFSSKFWILFLKVLIWV